MTTDTRVSDELPANLAATFPPKLPENWPEVLQSRADARHLGDTKGTIDLLRATAVYLRQLSRSLGVDDLAQEIRRVDGNHDKGAGELAEALLPFLRRSSSIDVERVRAILNNPSPYPESDLEAMKQAIAHSALSTPPLAVQDGEIAELLAKSPQPHGLPKAYGGCTCSCHRMAGVMHIAPCCRPSDDQNSPLMTREWFERAVKLEGDTDVTNAPTPPSQAIDAGDGEPAAWRYSSAFVTGPDMVKVWLHTSDRALAEREAASGNAVQPLYTHPAGTVSVSDGMGWQAGEREIAERWLVGLAARLGSKPDHANDVLWLERLRALLFIKQGVRAALSLGGSKE